MECAVIPLGQGSHGFYTVAAMTNVNNFGPTLKGKVMGSLAAFFAFSSVLWTPIGQSFGLSKHASTNHTSGNGTSAGCGPATPTPTPTTNTNTFGLGEGPQQYGQ